MRIILFILISIISLGCVSKKMKDVSYLENFEGKNLPTLNVFTPRKTTEKLPVLIFIHGGNWNTGNKNMYGFFGRNFAKKGVVTVIPGYTLSPDASYDEMAKQVAEAIRWTKLNIGKFNGDPDRIYITGHSAGGHLAALAVMNPKYKIDAQTIKGIILNDAAGLDMKHYLEENSPTEGNDYLKTWTNNSEKWQEASPIYFLNKETPPFLIYVGSKTYESIKIGNSRFINELKKYQPDPKIVEVNKSHIPMILQYINSSSLRFNEIKEFMNTKL